ncbi:MAG TPA: enolase C-terminal domain-like protein [Candidatus Acidoferrales bacterium]|nr:enolase C-terminal domain-like protein [Candidatus Acidoferrales bacterium]
MNKKDCPIRAVSVAAYTVPTDSPESDGTLAWDKTTLVLVHASAAGKVGMGYTYADVATAGLIEHTLIPLIRGTDAMAVPDCWSAMRHVIRNLGRPGICSMAIAAVDCALWDLKAKLLDLPLVSLLGAAQPSIEIYGSGGFTSYSVGRLQKQLSGWAEQGIKAVKMKIGREPDKDTDRVKAAREAIGRDVALYVDANGAYSRKQALRMAQRFEEFDVSWFEEPVTSDDLEGLRLIRDRAPARMDIAAGEYGYEILYFKRMLDAEAVDVQQADATRCAGISEFLRVGALCEAANMPMSAHTSPSLHLHPCCAISCLRNIEYFHDHVRIEKMFFDGVIQPVGGRLRPDLSRPGMGLEFKRANAERYRA